KPVSPLPGDADDVKPVAFCVTAWLTLVCLRSWIVAPGMISTLAGVSSGVMLSRLPVCDGTSRLRPGLLPPSPPAPPVAVLALCADAATEGAGAAFLAAAFALTAFFFGAAAVTSTCGRAMAGAGAGAAASCAAAVPVK